MSSTFGAAVAAAMKAGNVVTQSSVGATGSGPAVQYSELSLSSQAEQLRHAALLKRVDAERRARRIVVPTGDDEVRRMLRKLGHPVRLFGETPADARDRLREILARIEIDGEERALVASLLADDAAEAALEKASAAAPGSSSSSQPAGAAASLSGASSKAGRGDVYAPASEELYAARLKTATFSFARAKTRLAEHKRRRDDAEASLAHERVTARCYASVQRLGLSQSQVADARPACRVRASPLLPVVATAAWSGLVKVWAPWDDCALVATLPCGDDRVTGLAWSPKAPGDLLAVGSADKTASLWRTPSAQTQTTQTTEEEEKGGPGTLHVEKPSLLYSCTGHRDRLGNVAFHPSGDAFATTSYDHTWRLWDVESGAQLLLQDGHDRETYAIAFHTDGSLVATGDFAGIVHVWDLRSGKLVHTALGHGGKILAAGFAPDGYRLATGSDDHAVRVWDLRRRACDYVLPAHSALVSDLAWAPHTGEVLATAAFDGSIALWSTRDWTALHTLKAHDGKAMSLDFAPPTLSSSSSSFSGGGGGGENDGPATAGLLRDHALVSCGWDRTLKVWTADGLAAF